MSVSYEDLNPRKSKIVLQGKTYVLSPFTLAKQLWAVGHFATEENKNGLAVLHQRLGDPNDWEAWTTLLYELLEDKSDFPTLDGFIKIIKKEIKRVSELAQALVECIGNSQPPQEDAEVDQELGKS